MVSNDLLLEIYKKLYTIRVFEHRCIKLYREGAIRGYFHPYLGEEAIAVGVCTALDKKDYITSTHRGHGHCIAKGADIRKMVAELLGKETGYCRGLGGSMHIADVTAGNLGANGIVGGGLPMGVGAGLGAWMRGEKRVSVVFFSDGATNNGVFAESLNLAAIWNLPVLFMLENNQYAANTPIEQAAKDTDLYKRTKGYGVEGLSVDGNDVLEVYEKTKAALKNCREGKGPILIEAKTYRHGGHHVNDPGQYMPADRMEYYKSKDPVLAARAMILKKEKAMEDKILHIEQRVEEEMEEAVEYAKSCREMSVPEFYNMVEG
ncbi:MAG: thiamine pyrophosphate-dependent dehydrogenase E1 component subunit alpha [bacterium]